MRPSIVEGSVAMMRATQAAGVRTFVFASTLLVYPDQPEQIDRSTVPGPLLGYGQAKLEAELELAQLGRQTGMTVAILRLPHVYGGRDLLMYRALHGLVILPRPGDKPVAHLHVSDVARALIDDAELGFQGALPIGDDHPAPWMKFLAELRERLPTLRQLIVPVALVKAGLHLFSPVRLLNGRPLSTRLKPCVACSRDSQ